MPRLLLVIPLCIGLWAQEPGVFTAKKTLVTLHVTVKDKDGVPVDGLDSSAFRVRESGRSVSVQLDSERPPLRVVVLVQNNRGVAKALTKAVRAGSLLLPLVAGDSGRVAVLSFSDEVRELLPFSADEAAVVSAFRGIRPMGSGNRVHDALLRAAELLENSPQDSRRVVLVIGESRDRDSKVPLEEVQERFLRSGSSAYFVSYSAYLMPFTGKPVYDENNVRVMPEAARSPLAELFRRAGPEAGFSLATVTGGVKTSFLSQGGLEGAIARIGAELHTAYQLSFTPAPGEAGLRTISVEVPGCERCLITARTAYWWAP